MSVLETVLLGSLSSLIATILWVIIIFLYDYNAHGKIEYYLEECDNATRLLINSIKYTRYLVALSQVDKLLDLYLQIDECLKPLNFAKRKRKLIKLLVFNMIRVLNIFKNLEIGYDEDEELKSRCIKFQEKYLYEIETQVGATENFMIISIAILRELNQTFGVKNAIRKSLNYFTMEQQSQRKILHALIEVNSFRNANVIKYFMNTEVLTKREYEEIVKSI